MKRYYLAVYWDDGRLSFSRPFAGRNCANRKAAKWREVARVWRVDVCREPAEWNGGFRL